MPTINQLVRKKEGLQKEVQHPCFGFNFNFENRMNTNTNSPQKRGMFASKNCNSKKTKFCLEKSC